MADGKKWPEVSNYTQIKVDPDMDPPSFKRAMRDKQEEIHKNRHRRMKKIGALEYECAINDILVTHWADLRNPQTSETRVDNWTQSALQAVAKLAPRKPGEDGRLAQPERALDERQFLPNSSKSILKYFESMDENLNEKKMDKDELESSLQEDDASIWDTGNEVARRMYGLQIVHRIKTAKENHYIPLDEPPASKAKPGEIVIPELLNPNRDPNETTAAPDTRTGIEALFPKHKGKDSPSEAAMAFANIQPGDYQASRDYISSHPEILHEFESTGLLILAVENGLWGTDYNVTRQRTHQAVVLDRCRALKPHKITNFFEKMITRDKETCEKFKKDVEYRNWGVRQLHVALRGQGISGSPLGSRPPSTSRALEALGRKLEMMDIGRCRRLGEPPGGCWLRECRKGQVVFDATKEQEDASAAGEFGMAM